MGWTYSSEWITKKEIVNHCIDWGARFQTLDHSVRGNRLWVLLKYNEGEKKDDVFVALYLLSKERSEFGQPEWGYKDMDDTVGPCYYDCPISFIKRTEDSCRVLGASTIKWHKEVRDYQQKRRNNQKASKDLKPGMKLQLHNVIYQLIKRYPGRLGWEVKSLEDGVEYRMMAKQLLAATILE